MPDPLLDARGVAELLGGAVSPDAVKAWRLRGTGPTGWFRLVGRRWVIRRSAVQAWLEARERGAA